MSRMYERAFSSSWGIPILNNTLTEHETFLSADTKRPTTG